MGWTYIDKPYSPKEYLDSIHKSADPNIKMEVLKSALKNFKVYYAAVKSTNIRTGKLHIWCSVIRVDFHGRGNDAQISYKCIDEAANPIVAECPESILKLLTAAGNEHAARWRERCWENIRRRKALSKMLVHGKKVRFKKPVKFTSGAEHQELYVWKHCKTLRFSVVPVPPKDKAMYFDMPCYNIGRDYLLRNLEISL